MGAINNIILADAEVAFSDLGEDITYTPCAVGVSAFATTAIVGRLASNDIMSAGLKNATTALIKHSDLTAGGLTEPTPKSGATAGDTLTIADINGSAQVWLITDADLIKAGYWQVTIERDYRFRP